LDANSDEIYIAPSGVQKERMRPCHMFVMNVDGSMTLSTPPSSCRLTPSQCTPLFFNAYRERNAGACIHTHSQAAVMVTLLSDKHFVITHQVSYPLITCPSSSIYDGDRCTSCIDIDRK
jgi:methylthioribulose-1-phosphate dehydratase